MQFLHDFQNYILILTDHKRYFNCFWFNVFAFSNSLNYNKNKRITLSGENIIND